MRPTKQNKKYTRKYRKMWSSQRPTCMTRPTNLLLFFGLIEVGLGALGRPWQLCLCKHIRFKVTNAMCKSSLKKNQKARKRSQKSCKFVYWTSRMQPKQNLDATLLSLRNISHVSFYSNCQGTLEIRGYFISKWMALYNAWTRISLFPGQGWRNEGKHCRWTRWWTHTKHTKSSTRATDDYLLERGIFSQ